MKLILAIILSIPVIYLAASAIYQLVLALASKRYRSPKLGAKAAGRTLILVPAYREDAVILSSTEANLKQIPNDGSCDYLVLADKLKSETITKLKELGAEVLEVSLEKSTKVKSLKAGMDLKANRTDYGHVVILDADNRMESDFIPLSLQFRGLGYRVLQGERLAANSKNGMEILDGLSEKANQEMLCKGANELGLSSKLTGSAMVLDINLFRIVLPQLQAIGGFDKEMELILTSMKESIQYAPELRVWDEKVSNSQAFAKQRGRWLESQYTFFKKSIKPSTLALMDGNVDYFHKSLQLALPPRVLAPVALTLLFALCMIVGLTGLAWVSGLAWIALISSYLLVLPTSMWRKDLGQILATLPGLVLAAFSALRWMKRSKKEFLHTSHTLTES